MKILLAFASVLIILLVAANYLSSQREEQERYRMEESSRVWQDTYQKGIKKSQDKYEKTLREEELKSNLRKISAEMAKKYGREDTWNADEYDKKRKQELRDELQREQLEELQKIREKLEQ